MTVLRYFESIKLPTTFDSSSITNVYDGKPINKILKGFKSFCKGWIRKFGSKIRSKLTLSKFESHESSYRFKSGPMGPSILTSHLCALALFANQEYHNVFKEFCLITNSGALLRLYKQSVDLCIINVGNLYKLITGRISLAAEPAGKTRLFAICNFWVQSALKPFHNQLMLTLKLFKADGTFNQIEQFNRILKETKGLKTYCFDLSKATDRFPIKLQAILIEVIVNKEFANA
jgi:hypothetical protein